MSPTITRRRLLILVNLLVLGFAAVSLAKIITTQAPDFSVFYQSAVNLNHGVNVYRDPSLFTGLGYPVTSLIPFIPLVYLPYRLAQGIWVFGSFLAFLGSLVLALKLVGKLTWKTILITFPLGFLSFPTRFTLGLGQVNFYALLFLLLSIYWLRRKPWRALTSLVIALIIKPHFFLLLPAYFLAGKWKTAVAAALSYALITLATGVGFGWFQITSYVREALPPLLAFGGREIYYNQGLAGFWSRLLGSPESAWLTLVSASGLFLFTFLVLWRRKTTLTISLAMFLLVLLLIEPLAWQHHFVFLLPVFIWLWRKSTGTITRLWTLASFALISFNIKDPLIWSKTWFGPLILSHVFIGTVIVYILYLSLLFRQRSAR